MKDIRASLRQRCWVSFWCGVIEGFHLSAESRRSKHIWVVEDEASHATRVKSAFNAVLFGPSGYTDVYLIYGLHHCLNVSCHPAGQSGGVLIRALQPVAGFRRWRDFARYRRMHRLRRISGGPGRVCQALGITRANAHGLDVTSHSSAIQIVDDSWIPPGIRVTKRIGIRKSVDLPLRFLIADEEV